MSALLIHSMSEFSDIILTALEISNSSQLVEIGAEFGGMSKMLVEHVEKKGGHLHSIDPVPKPEFERWVQECKHVTHISKTSLESVGGLKNVDAWIIDGDHNWYTVYHELEAIQANCSRDNKPFLAVLHDVCWPSGHRDMYYDPSSIPDAYRHDFCMVGGVKPGHSGILPERGFRGMGSFGWAIHEGGERNGVKCAVVDFISEFESRGQKFAYAEIPAVFGLGIVFSADAPWADKLSEYLLPFNNNRLIAKLEENRLANYLAVIDWQDAK